MKKIKKIAPRSVARVLGFLYGLVGLIGGLIFFVISLVSIVSGHGGTWFSLVFVVILPIIYGVLAFLIGYVGAWLYNVVAKKVGGIELELE